MTSPVQDAVSTAVLVHLALRRESRKDLAAALGVHPSAVTHRLSGSTKWSLDDLDKLARHWDVSPAQLLNPPVAAFAGAGFDQQRVGGSIGTGRKRRLGRQRIGGSILTLPLPRTAFEVVAA